MIAKHTGLEPEEISKKGVEILDLEDNKAAFTQGNSNISLYFNVKEMVGFFVGSGYLSKAPDVDELLSTEFLE